VTFRKREGIPDTKDEVKQKELKEKRTEGRITGERRKFH
jgi:hypothetical protein